jgi:membrane carboxypeptidase/penicillin-binding protein PbpC
MKTAGSGIIPASTLFCSARRLAGSHLRASHLRRQHAHHAGGAPARSPSAHLWRQNPPALAALQLEWHLSKRDILTLYLNRAPFGGTLQGVGAASWTYLGKPPSQLSYSEAALLAVLPQAPAVCARTAGRSGPRRRA